MGIAPEAISASCVLNVLSESDSQPASTLKNGREAKQNVSARPCQAVSSRGTLASPILAGSATGEGGNKAKPAPNNPHISAVERRSKLLLRSRVNDGLNSTSGPSPVKRLAAARALAREMRRMLGADDPMEAHKLDSRGIYARGRSDDVKEGVTAFLQKRPAVFGLNSSNIKRPRNRSRLVTS